MSPPEVLVHHDSCLLAKAAAARLVTRLVDAQAASAAASLVLTGGGIGTAILAELAAAGEGKPSEVATAIEKYGLDPEAIDPRRA